VKVGIFKIRVGLPLRPRRCAVWGVLLGAALVFLADAHAQFGGMGGMGGMGAGRGSRGPSVRAPDAGDVVNRDNRGTQGQLGVESLTFEQLEYRLNTLQVDLNLTQADAISAWQAFAARVLEHGADQARERMRAVQPGAGAVSAPQHLRQVVDGARNNLSGLEEIEIALAVLYPMLRPDQRVIADARVATIVAPRLPRRLDPTNTPGAR